MIKRNEPLCPEEKERYVRMIAPGPVQSTSVFKGASFLDPSPSPFFFFYSPSSSSFRFVFFYLYFNLCSSLSPFSWQVQKYLFHHTYTDTIRNNIQWYRRNTRLFTERHSFQFHQQISHISLTLSALHLTSHPLVRWLILFYTSQHFLLYVCIILPAALLLQDLTPFWTWTMRLLEAIFLWRSSTSRDADLPHESQKNSNNLLPVISAWTKLGGWLCDFIKQPVYLFLSVCFPLSAISDHRCATDPFSPFKKKRQRIQLASIVTARSRERD